jgi:hypothetical protein
MSEQIESALSQSLPSFDQIVKGDVCIKKLSKYRYRITFSKIGKFLVYQVWDKDDVKMNAKRQVGYVSAKEWVKLFKTLNNSKPLFTPTTIMETENRVYAFVIHTVSLNSRDKVVFTVSTEEISLQNNTSKKLVQLPLGKCNHVRFDIDDFICCDRFILDEKNLFYPPNFVTSRINFTIISIANNNKTGKDIPVDQLQSYLSFYQKYTVWPYWGCSTIMGVDCGVPENIEFFNRWKKAMDDNNVICPDTDIKPFFSVTSVSTIPDFSSSCSSGCSMKEKYFGTFRNCSD